MHVKKIVSTSTWVDPDDASERNLEMLARGEINITGQISRRGRTTLAMPKKLVSLRLDQDDLERLRALGPGWQTRANAALRALVECNKNEPQS